MSKLDESLDATTIANIGHIYYAPVGTPFPKLNTFDFTGEDWGSWKWFGDTSAETLPEFEEDDDKDSNKDTWDRKDTRTGGSITGTIKSVSPSKTFWSVVKEGGIEEEDGYVTTSRTRGKTHALLIVVEDGSTLTGIGYYIATLKAGLLGLDREKYTEVPVKVTVKPDSEDRWHKTFYPVKRQSAAAPAVRDAGVAA